MKKLGTLNHRDPLYSWLVEYIYPKIGLSANNLIINVYQIKASHNIYAYEAWQKGRVYLVIGKFYGNEISPMKHFRNEINHFLDFKRMGLARGSHRTPHLLGYHRYINFVLVTEYVQGKRLDQLINEAIHRDTIGSKRYPKKNPGGK